MTFSTNIFTSNGRLFNCLFIQKVIGIQDQAKIFNLFFLIDFEHDTLKDL